MVGSCGLQSLRTLSGTVEKKTYTQDSALYEKCEVAYIIVEREFCSNIMLVLGL